MIGAPSIGTMRCSAIAVLLATSTMGPADSTPEEQIILQKGLPYKTCLTRQFNQLRTPDFESKDVFPLMRIKDEDVFASIKRACIADRDKILAEMPASQTLPRALDRWDAINAQNYLLYAKRERATLDPKIQAIRVPGPRPAVPLVEAFLNEDYPPRARHDREQGQVTATFAVDTNGRVSDCKAVGGTDALNIGACGIIVRRWRYAPAINAEGRPVPEIRTKPMTFIFRD